MTANSFGSRATLEAGGATHEIYRLDAVPGSENLPYSLKVLLEDLYERGDRKHLFAARIDIDLTGRGGAAVAEAGKGR